MEIRPVVPPSHPSTRLDPPAPLAQGPVDTWVPSEPGPGLRGPGAGFMASVPAMAAAAPAPAAPPTVPPAPGSSVLRDPITLPEGENGTLFVPDGSGSYRREHLNYVYGYNGNPDHFHESRDEGGRTWVCFPTLDHHYALNVVDPGGRLAARVSLSVGCDHVRDVLLDARSRRVYVLAARYSGPDARNTLAAVDLETGKEAARREFMGAGGATVQITPRGTLAVLTPDGFEELDRDLRTLRTLAEKEFVPSRIREIPGGSILMEGSTFYKDGTAYSDYYPHRSLWRPDGTRLGLSPGKAWLDARDGRLDWMAYQKGELVSLDLATGNETRRPAPYEASAAVVREDGSLLAVYQDSGSAALKVVSERGRVVEQHNFGDSWPDLHTVFLHDGDRRADVAVRHKGQYELHRVDLPFSSFLEGLVGGLRKDEDEWTRHQVPLHTSPRPFVPLALKDGRTLCLERAGLTLLDAAGKPQQTFPDLASARTALGAALQPVSRPFPGVPPFAGCPADLLAAAEQVARDSEGRRAGPIRFQVGTAGPAEVQHLLPPVEAADLEGTLWGRAVHGVALGPALSLSFPGGGATLKGAPEGLQVNFGDQVLSKVEPPRGHRFTRVLPLETPDSRLVAAASSDGAVMVYNANSDSAQGTGRRYPTDSTVIDLAVGPQGTLVARCADGTVLDVDTKVGLRAAERTRRSADPEGAIESRADEVQIGGVTLPVQRR